MQNNFIQNIKHLAPQMAFLVIPILFIALLGQAQTTRPNILFLAIDDLRPELGCYGNSVVQSPNLDEIAESGVLFQNHYAVVPTCGASRYSLLCGLLPRSQVAINNRAMMTLLAGQPEPDVPETFIHHLKRNGYYTVGIGKIAHSADGLVYGYEDEPSDQLELPYSWNEMLFDPGKWGNGWNAFFGYADGSNRQGKKKLVYPYETGEVDDDGYPDGLTANLAVKKLEELKERNEPFFLGVGFFKPHLPFTAPKKYWDLYDPDSIRISPSPDLPEDINIASLHTNNEFNHYELGDEKASLDSSLSEAYARKLIQSYYACISYTDALVGKVVDKLKELGLYENTCIIIWGDHGWHLGDHRIWGKHTLFDRALKSALIIKPANHPDPGQTVEQFVSTIDIYPTIMEQCNLDGAPKTDGQSLVPLWKGQSVDWKNTVYGYFRKGVTMRTPQYRITKYYREAEPSIELFDHYSDPFEQHNIAGKNENLVKFLMKKWKLGYTGIHD